MHVTTRLRFFTAAGWESNRCIESVDYRQIRQEERNETPFYLHFFMNKGSSFIFIFTMTYDVSCRKMVLTISC